MQKKETIYIDIEDDITSIIGKVKSAKEKTVLLVPPKRTGVLQSAVNLRLLARTAESANKNLIIVTHNAALGGLAAAADIPVAKTLQAHPEILKIATKDQPDEDVIDGSSLPIGDHADLSNKPDNSVDEITIEDIEIDGELLPSKKPKDTSVAPQNLNKKTSNIKVPDFGSFRKKLGVAIVALVGLVAFLYWALVIAPQATVVISARTTDLVYSSPVSLGPDLASNSDKATLKSIKQSDKVLQTLDFNATGTKDIGDKATGSVSFSTNSISMLGTTIPAGTNLISSSGLVFLTTQNVTFNLSNYNDARTGITASASGTKYNGVSGSLSGAPPSVVASLLSATAGGTEKIVKVVSQADIDKAQQQLTENNQSDVKKKLKAKFQADAILIESSFLAGEAKVTSLPSLGLESTDGKAKLTIETTYSMVGVAKDELRSYLEAVFQKQLNNKSDERIYDSGADSVKLDDYKVGDKVDTASMIATAKRGPKINENDIKLQVKGKRSGEIVGDLKAIDGVNSVQVKLSPFWVQGAPDDIKKIFIEFKLKSNE